MSEKVVCKEVVCERWCVAMLPVEKLCVCVNPASNMQVKSQSFDFRKL